MKITVASVSLPVCRGLRKAVKNWKEGSPPDVVVLDAKKELSLEERQCWEERMMDSDLIIVDLMGSPKSVVETVYASLKKTKSDILPIGGFEMTMGRLGSFEPGKMAKKNIRRNECFKDEKYGKDAKGIRSDGCSFSGTDAGCA